MLTFKLLFGVRMCRFCPDCNGGDGAPCQNLFGSSSIAEGGIFSRVDAVYTSVEAQKYTGSLHAHSQLFVECMHQHTPLVGVMQRIKGDGATLVQRYLRYKSHAANQVHTDPVLAEANLHHREAGWPEYKDSTLFVFIPPYMTARSDVERPGPPALAL